MLKGRDLLSIHELTVGEVEEILELAAELKAKQKAGIEHKLLAGKTLGMIFEKSSTRTRVSFETGMYQLGGQALFLKPEKLLYGIVVLVLETMVLDQVMLFGTAQIQIFAVSPHYEQIRLRLLTELEAGVTMTMIETGCLEKQQKGVLCVIPNRKLFAATELIQEIDPEAFITVTKIKEVRGRGFTSERKTLEID